MIVSTYARRLMALAVVSSLSIPASAHALSDSEVKHFIDSLPAVDKLADDMEKEGKDIAMEPMAGGDMPSKFTPYTDAVSKLKSGYPDEYDNLDDIVEEYDFGGPEEWAQVGDDVMRAYTAHHMDSSMPKNMDFAANMTPEMLAMMPPEAKAQMQATQNMLKDLQDVSEEDKEALKPHIPALEAWMNQKAQ